MNQLDERIEYEYRYEPDPDFALITKMFPDPHSKTELIKIYAVYLCMKLFGNRPMPQSTHCSLPRNVRYFFYRFRR